VILIHLLETEKTLTLPFLLFFTFLDLANNKIKSLAGLSNLKHLRKLDLGANRIRVMEEAELGGLVNLEELWIGKNKIEQIQGLDKVRFALLLSLFSCSLLYLSFQ
jgi:Leucine-rich repeat (LRR) protein